MEEITIYTDGACSGNPGPGDGVRYLCIKKIKRNIRWEIKYNK